MAGMAILTSHITAPDEVNGDTWFGDAQWYMRALNEDGEVDTFVEAIPRVQAYRVPFNVDQFDAVTGDLYSEQAEIITDLVANGYSLIWDLHDGPCQELSTR